MEVIMKIIQKRSTENFQDNHDYRNALMLNINNANGSKLLRFFDGEREDNNLIRNFKDCYNIVDAIKMAYESGKNGEELEIVDKEINEWDDMY